LVHPKHGVYQHRRYDALSAASSELGESSFGTLKTSLTELAPAVFRDLISRTWCSWD
jgi:hypothetical protein